MPVGEAAGITADVAISLTLKPSLRLDAGVAAGAVDDDSIVYVEFLECFFESGECLASRDVRRVEPPRSLHHDQPDGLFGSE